MSKRFGSTIQVLLAGCCVLTSFCLSAFAGDSAKNTDKTWVSVTMVEIGRNTTAEYLGQIENEALNGITNHSMSNGFFKLESTCWYDAEGKIKQLKGSIQQGQLYGYSNTIFLRVDLICRIVLMDPTLMNNIFAKEKP